jgi:hypothetical protein
MKVEYAFLKMDMAALEKAFRPIVTADFKYVQDGKPMGYDKMVSTVTKEFVSFAKMKSSSSKTVKLTRHGDIGEAVIERKQVGILKGAEKSPHVMTFHGFTNDSFRKVDGKWKLASMTWTKSDLTLDGKPFNPMKSASGGR